jgi:hypothetical protein
MQPQRRHGSGGASAPRTDVVSSPEYPPPNPQRRVQKELQTEFIICTLRLARIKCLRCRRHRVRKLDNFGFHKEQKKAVTTTWSAETGRWKCQQNFCGKIKGKDYYETSAEGKTILISILSKQEMQLWIGQNWLRILYSGGFLLSWQWTFGSQKWRILASK